MKRDNTLRYLVSFLIFLMVVGTIGYQALYPISWIDSLYMTIITMSTTGYREIVELDAPGQLFTIILILSSLGVVGLVVSRMMTVLIESNFSRVRRLRMVDKTIGNYKGHYIVCGGGETGINAVERLKRSKKQYVIIEEDKELYEDLLENQYVVIHGDATYEDILEKAGVRRARGLISALDSDLDNLYAVITARQLNDNLNIVSRAIEKGAEKKLKIAGANNVISPNEIGGSRMAMMMIRPSVLSFLDVITHAGDKELDLEEVTVKSKSLIGKSLAQARIPAHTGLTVLAIQKTEDPTIQFNPHSSVILEEDDRLYVLGMEGMINTLRNWAEADISPDTCRISEVD